EILRQFIPFVRLDGYWLLADLTGVPDFFAHVGQLVRRVASIPGAAGPRLRRPARVAVGAYVVVTFVALPILFAVAVNRMPRLVLIAWNSLGEQRQALSASFAAHSLLGVASSLVQSTLLLIELLGI